MVQVDDQQELGADEGRDDDVDAEVHHLGPADAAPLSRRAELQPEQIARRQQEAVGVDADGTQFKQLRIHAVPS